MTVRELSPSDIPEVARIHLAAFPESVLSKLGAGPVSGYYRWLMTGPHDLYAVGVEENGRLLGFAFTGIFRGAASGFIRHNWLSLSGHLLLRPWLIFKVRDRLGLATIWRLLSAALTMRKPRVNSTPPAPLPVAPAPATSDRPFGVLSIATDPSVQRRGVGGLLMDAAESRASQLGYSSVYLTVHPSNTRALSFYERGGWTRILDSDGEFRGSMKKVVIPAGSQRES